MSRVLLAVAALVALISIAPPSAQAATLSVTPASGVLSVGERINVRMTVSGDAPLNAVGATLLFSNDVLSVESVTKGPVLNFWVTEPTFSNTAGTIQLEGISLSGFTGGSGTVLTITFRAKSPGAASVKFQSGQVLANDGQGSDITSGLSGASYTVVAATPKPTPQPSEKPSTAPGTDASIEAPTIVSYAQELSQGDSQKIVGFTYGNATVSIFVRNEAGEPITQEFDESDFSGDFEILISKELKPGTYTITATVEHNGFLSPETAKFLFVVSSPATDVAEFLIKYLSLLTLAAFSLIGIAVSGMYGWYRLIALQKGIRREQGEAEVVLGKSFRLLEKDITKRIHELKEVRQTRAYSDEEVEFLKQLSEDLEEARNIIEKEVKDIGLPPSHSS